MNINIYNPYVREELYLMHHGIAGQKWGKRNGPPYPLAAGAHSASEKKAGWRQSLADKRDEKKQFNNYKKSLINASISDKYYDRAKAAERLGNDKKYEKNLNKALKYDKKRFDAAEKVRAIEDKRGILNEEKYGGDLKKKYRHVEQDKEKRRIDNIYERADRRNRPLTEKEQQKLRDAYIARMTDDEVKKVVDWAKRYDQIEREASASWEKYDKEFNSDPKRRKITESWDGDGTELYRKMQEIMPNKRDQAIQDKDLEVYSEGDALLRGIANRITKGDKEHRERTVFTRRGIKHPGGSNSREALGAVEDISNNVRSDIARAKSDAWSDVNRLIPGVLTSTKDPNGKPLSNKRDLSYMKRNPYDVQDSLVTRRSKKNGIKESDTYAEEYSKQFDEAISYIKNNKHVQLTKKGEEALKRAELKKPAFNTSSGTSESRIVSRVKQMKASGKTYAQIADALQISESSVGNILKGKYK